MHLSAIKNFLPILAIFAILHTANSNECRSEERDTEHHTKAGVVNKIYFYVFVCKLDGIRKHLDFFLVGDNGGFEFEIEKDGQKHLEHRPTPGQLAVAKNMYHHEHIDKQYHDKFEPNFVINLGDNFYNVGITMADRDERFAKNFIKVYEKDENENVLMNVPWYSVGGNNDYKMSSDELKKLDEKIEDLKKNEEQNKAEIEKLEKKKLALIHELDELKKLDERIEDLRKNEEESKAEFKRLEEEKLALIHELFIMGQKRLQAQMNYEKSKLWKFPTEQYMVEYKFEYAHGHSATAIFVMVDTVMLCGASRKDFIVHDSREKQKQKRVHTEWLEAVLDYADKQNPDYLFVAGHYPIYVTEGKRAFGCAIGLNELFLKHRVTAYLSGHEHNLKHVKQVKHAEGETKIVEQIVSGAGSRMEYCMKPKHIAGMDEEIPFCYPNVDFKPLKKSQSMTEPKKKQAEKGKALKKSKSEAKKDEEGVDDDDTVFDGGAFISVRIAQDEAEFKFWATGGNIYTGNGPNKQPMMGWNPKKTSFEADREMIAEGLRTEHLKDVKIQSRKANNHNEHHHN